ncbi:MAG: substrate-binding domain-containing protein [Gemmatimonadota bacterium]|nr:substrate-binding domain-containing protein [Gemmatimonadota bacterium]MDE2871690.1 substrate-binding domain-containing protein [Gemmatimonadota bacterium]
MIRGCPVRAGAAALVVAATGCAADAGRAGRVLVVDGSSSLYPLSEAVAEEFAERYPGSRVVVRVSGTGGGLRRFCEGEADIAGASRAMTSAEAERCRAAGIRYLAIPVARDGVAVVANTANGAAACLTLAELRRLWEPGSGVATWRDLRPAFPAEKIRLFGPGNDSGTFRFFTTVVVGRPGASRADHYQTEDDHLIARGVAGNRWGLGYLGSAGYAADEDLLRVLAVDTGFGCVHPTPGAIRDGSYSPLARDLYIYVGYVRGGGFTLSEDVYRFAVHYVSVSGASAEEVGYAPLPAARHARSLRLLAAAREGSS